MDPCPPKINFDIAKRKKSKTAEDVFRSNFNEIRTKFPNYQCIYTDGSRTNDGVAAAAVTPTYSMSKAYNKSNSIFSAELRALILALEYIKTTNHRNYIIFSDSKSSLLALQDLQISNPLVCRALELHTALSFYAMNTKISYYFVGFLVTSASGVMRRQTGRRKALLPLPCRLLMYQHQIGNPKLYNLFKI